MDEAEAGRCDADADTERADNDAEAGAGAGAGAGDGAKDSVEVIMGATSNVRRPGSHSSFSAVSKADAIARSCHKL